MVGLYGCTAAGFRCAGTTAPVGRYRTMPLPLLRYHVDPVPIEATMVPCSRCRGLALPPTLAHPAPRSTCVRGRPCRSRVLHLKATCTAVLHHATCTTVPHVLHHTACAAVPHVLHHTICTAVPRALHHTLSAPVPRVPESHTYGRISCTASYTMETCYCQRTPTRMMAPARMYIPHTPTHRPPLLRQRGVHGGH